MNFRGVARFLGEQFFINSKYINHTPIKNASSRRHSLRDEAKISNKYLPPFCGRSDDRDA